nr:MAG TPA: hypothetical protein [Caudoviricetes sp.]
MFIIHSIYINKRLNRWSLRLRGYFKYTYNRLTFLSSYINRKNIICLSRRAPGRFIFRLKQFSTSIKSITIKEGIFYGATPFRFILSIK